MSKINAVRFINLNYNNQSIRISDETFHLNGESTLLSLRNGGGKSVLVQMLTALFVINATGMPRTARSRAILPRRSPLSSWWNGRWIRGRATCSRA